jgi:hypothetical protein
MIEVNVAQLDGASSVVYTLPEGNCMNLSWDPDDFLMPYTMTVSPQVEWKRTTFEVVSLEMVSSPRKP